MSTQHDDEYAWTWEPWAGALLGIAVAALLALHAARGVALWAAGIGFHWTPSTALFTSLRGLLTGDVHAGLDTSGPASIILTWVVAAVLTAGVIAVASILALRHHQRRRFKGMASTATASKLLGVDRLRANRKVIRPDIYRDRKTRFTSPTTGWRIGRSQVPAGVDLWQPWDRTAGAIGPQGSGKTLDILSPALLQAPGAALVTLTKVDDLLLTMRARQDQGPVAVLDPFGAAPGLPELIWDPVAGCVDAGVAEKRAKAFCAGTIQSSSGGGGDSAARFYAAEAAKVIQCYLHAAALAGLSLEHILSWAANPRTATLPGEILRTHPQAEPNWYGLLAGAITNADERTAANTRSTVDQALALFATRDRRERCVPSAGRPAVDLKDLIRNNGTIYLLGREDPYVSASPLMTAVAEHVLDLALELANEGGYGRLCPPMLACLDELPSTAPLPTLATRMANERALGISIIWASQTWQQLVKIFGEQQARAIKDLTNTLIVFGGSKDTAFNKELSDLLGTRRTTRRNYQHGITHSMSSHGEDIPVIRPEELRELPTRTALVIAENGKPIIARLLRAIDGKPGKKLLALQRAARTQIATQGGSSTTLTTRERSELAIAQARELGFTDAEY